LKCALDRLFSNAVNLDILMPSNAETETIIAARYHCLLGCCHRLRRLLLLCMCSSAVYVLDTGVRTSHSDFRGRVGSGATTIGQAAADDNGHGTHVAGIALGAVHGVAPSAILHPIKVSLSCAVHCRCWLLQVRPAMHCRWGPRCVRTPSFRPGQAVSLQFK
jgi:hypothetical protein